MKPKKNIGESELFDDELKLKIRSKDLLEDDDPQEKDEPTPKTDDEAMDEQQLRIESLKIAVKIAKLFDEVQPSDLIEMSDEVFKYVQHQSLTSGEWDPTYNLDSSENDTDDEDSEEEEADTIEDFNLDDLESPEADKKEDKETANETEPELPKEFFDFKV